MTYNLYDENDNVADGLVVPVLSLGFLMAAMTDVVSNVRGCRSGLVGDNLTRFLGKLGMFAEIGDLDLFV